MKKVSILFMLTLFVVSVMSIGQGNTLHADEKSDTPSKTQVIKCPVSGKVISKEALNTKTEYKGKTYYFCCEKCQAEFLKNPEKYAQACPHKTMYICPMKECNYKTDKPGKCPKCGMELKKVTCECDHTMTEKKCRDIDKEETKTECAAKKECEKEEK